MPTPVRPTNISIPFASSGAKNTIPTPAAAGALASYTAGFPAVTMLPIASGGLPPFGQDFNGLLFDITSHTLWVNAGGQYRFDVALSTAMGGYPAGMVLQSDDGFSSYVSAVANNTTNFNSTPSSIGSLWLPYSRSAYSQITVATTGGDTVLTTVQSKANQIVVSGVLTSNATITLPAGSKNEWQIDNSTSGAFTVTVRTSGGSGVPIRQGTSDKVYGWGGGILYVQASAVTQSPGNSSKAQATTEFVTLADNILAASIAALDAEIDAIVASSVTASQLYYFGQI